MAQGTFADKSGARVDLALTLPVFVGYHLGVVFLKVKNASDLVTGPLLQLANGNREAYMGLTCAIGALFVGLFVIAGRGSAFRIEKFFQIAVEGVLYAVAMRFAADYVVGKLPILLSHRPAIIAPLLMKAPEGRPDTLTGVVMSLGAGFYEELAFRVVLFGLVGRAWVWLFVHEDRVPGPHRMSFRGMVILVVWAVIAASIFSGVHYIGQYGDKIELTSFVFRLVLGLALTLIYVTRGFAAAVWAHAAYDMWVMLF